MQEKIQQAIQDNNYQKLTGRLGVISYYDSVKHTATVMITKEQTDEIESILQNVMCPRMMGVQTVAPQPGDLCWVTFKSNNITQPLITQFYNHRYEEHDYSKQISSKNTLPTYLLGM